MQKRRFTVNLQGLGRKKGNLWKKGSNFCRYVLLPRPHTMHRLLHQRTVPVVPAYRTCCTTVPYLLYQRTVPVVPPYRTRCTPRPYPKKRQQFLEKRQQCRVPKTQIYCKFTVFWQKSKGSNFLKKGSIFFGYGRLVRLVRSAGTTGTFGWYDWYGLLVRLVRLAGTTGTINGYDW